MWFVASGLLVLQNMACVGVWNLINSVSHKICEAEGPFAVCSGSVRGPFGICSGSVQSPFVPRSSSHTRRCVVFVVEPTEVFGAIRKVVPVIWRDALGS